METKRDLVRTLKEYELQLLVTKASDTSVGEMICWIPSENTCLKSRLEVRRTSTAAVNPLEK
jgi:hypothetical protein